MRFGEGAKGVRLPGACPVDQVRRHHIHHAGSDTERPVKWARRGRPISRIDGVSITDGLDAERGVRMMMLDNKVAVIYGAGGAIGGAVARAFAREGARCFLTGRSLDKVDAIATDIRRSGGMAET